MGKKIFLIFASVAIVVLIGINVYLGRSKQASLQLPQTNSQTYPQTQTVISPVEAFEPVQKDSPDGKLTLLMKTVAGKTEVAYTFLVSGKEIFIKTVDPSIIISIPYNTWSPDGKYIFLKENDAAGARFFVISATVASSGQNDQTASITDLFAKKYPELKIKDVTGWGGINLVIVNSTKNDGSRGPSFWFEMPSHSFIQLSTHF